MPFRGTASSQRVVRPTIVIRYIKPSSNAAKGPTRSTCTWLNLLEGMGIACTGDRGFLVTLARWHATESLHQEAMFVRIPGQTKRAEISLRVAHIPGCAMLWMAPNIIGRSSYRTRGRRRPVETSHNMLTPSTSQVLIWREKDGAIKPIIVRFFERETRALVFRHKKAYAPKQADGPSNGRYLYSIFEDLTALTFAKMRALAADDRVAANWTSHGQIHYRLVDDPTIRNFTNVMAPMDKILG